MLARLWQCRDLESWQVGLAAPTTLTALLLLAGAWLALSASPGMQRPARLVAISLLGLLGTVTGVVLLGFGLGEWFRSATGDPSGAYHGATWLLMALGWPVVIGGIVLSVLRSGRTSQPSPLSEGARTVRRAVVGAALAGRVLFERALVTRVALLARVAGGCLADSFGTTSAWQRRSSSERTHPETP